MSDLSDERKKQIYEEELAKAKQKMQDEEAYREKVRQDLENSSDIEFVEETPPINDPAPPPVAEPVPPSINNVPPAVHQVNTNTKNRQKKRKGIGGMVFGGSAFVFGMALLGVGYLKGITIPDFLDSSRTDMELTAFDSSGLVNTMDLSVLGDVAEDAVLKARSVHPEADAVTDTETNVEDEIAEGSTAIFVPDGWNIEKSTPERMDITPDKNKGEVYVTYYFDVEKSGSIEQTHKDLYSWATQELEVIEPITRLSDTTELQVPGTRSIWSVVYYESSGVVFERLLGTIIRGSEVIIVLTDCPEVLLPVYNSDIVNSIQKVKF